MTQHSLPRFPFNSLVRSIRDIRTNRILEGGPSHTELLETQVYVGLNDADTRRQEHDTGEYVEILKQLCIEHRVPFSFDVINGGYIHDDGEYTEERTIVLTFIEQEMEVVDAIARRLCVLFNQESVLITTGLVLTRSVRVGPDDEPKNEDWREDMSQR